MENTQEEITQSPENLDAHQLMAIAEFHIVGLRRYLELLKHLMPCSQIQWSHQDAVSMEDHFRDLRTNGPHEMQIEVPLEASEVVDDTIPKEWVDETFAGAREVGMSRTLDEPYKSNIQNLAELESEDVDTMYKMSAVDIGKNA